MNALAHFAYFTQKYRHIAFMKIMKGLQSSYKWITTEIPENSVIINTTLFDVESNYYCEQSYI